MSKDRNVDQKNVVESAEAGTADVQAEQRQAKAAAQLKHRRQVLKAAAIAAPMLVTLHARSAFAGGNHNNNNNLGSSGINYGPGSYVTPGGNPTPDPIPQPGGCGGGGRCIKKCGRKGKCGGVYRRRW